jgi:hypothetical protein
MESAFEVYVRCFVNALKDMRKKLILCNDTGIYAQLDVEQVSHVSDVNNVDLDVLQNSPRGHFLFPSKKTHGGYDFLALFSKGQNEFELFIFQVTISRKHSFLQKHYVESAQRLFSLGIQIKEIHLIALLLKKHILSFVYDNSDSSMSNLQKIGMYNNEQRASVQLRR